VRKRRFADRCFVILILLALAGFFGAVAYSMVDPEPRQNGMSLFLRVPH
jgi:hypothetical protein